MNREAFKILRICMIAPSILIILLDRLGMVDADQVHRAVQRKFGMDYTPHTPVEIVNTEAIHKMLKEEEEEFKKRVNQTEESSIIGQIIAAEEPPKESHQSKAKVDLNALDRFSYQAFKMHYDSLPSKPNGPTLWYSVGNGEWATVSIIQRSTVAGANPKVSEDVEAKLFLPEHFSELDTFFRLDRESDTVSIQNLVTPPPSMPTDLIPWGVQIPFRFMHGLNHNEPVPLEHLDFIVVGSGFYIFTCEQ
jgi:hypothetical protein